MDTKISKSDIKFLLVFYAFALPIAFYDEDYDMGWTIPILNVTTYVIFSLLALYIIVYKVFPIFFPKGKVIQLFIFTTLVLLILGMIEIHIYKYFNNWDWKNPSTWKLLYFGLNSSLENGGILLGLFLGKKFYETQMEVVEKEREKKESELKRLKSQVDPHFLFNNLNTLDALIDDKPQVAKAYLQKLANLYRYLIKTKDHDTVILTEELNFISDYIFLIEKRFGSTFKFEINQNADVNHLHIAPGAIQTCLENVVKHNIASESEPIITTINIDSDFLTISNNVKLKAKRDINGTGLENLKARYRHLSDVHVAVENTDLFRVRIPLLKLTV